MKSINTLFVIAATVFAGSASHAQTADVSGVTANTAATAASINALADAINALHERVDALEVPSGNVTIDDLVGKTYCVSFFGNLAGTNAEENFARIGSYVGAAKLEITSTVLGSFTTQLDKEFELGWNLGFEDPNLVLDTSLQHGDHVNGPKIGGGDPDGAGPFAATINSFTNGVLNLTLGGDVENFTVSADGNMILNSNYSQDGVEGESNIIIGMSCI